MAFKKKTKQPEIAKTEKPPEKPATAFKSKYTVLSPVRYAGQRYAAGTTVEINDKVVVQGLINKKVIE